MLKKVFASILSMFMVITLLVPGGVMLDVKANEIEPYATIVNIPMSVEKTTYKSVSFAGETANVPITVELSYVKTINGSTITYTNFTAAFVTNSAVGSFKTSLKDNLQITKHLSSKTVYVMGEVNLIYNRGDYVNHIFGTKSFSIEFTLS